MRSRKLILLSLLVALLLAVGVTVGVTAALAGPGVVTGSGAGLMAGAAEVAITPTAAMLPIDGFTAIHDNIYVKVLLVKNGSNRMAFVVLDLTSANIATVNSMKAAITAAAGVPTQDVFVTCTHNFSSPHDPNNPGKPNSYSDLVVNATAKAAKAAVGGLKSAQVGYGTGTCDVNVNRNVLTKDGYFLGTNEAGPSDKRVGITRFDDLSGKPIAIIINYDCQSAIMQDSLMDDGSKPVTADLAGAATKYVESQYGNGVVALWMVGATGDQFPVFRSSRYALDKNGDWWYAYPSASPVQAQHKDPSLDLHSAGLALLTVQGERLGTEAVRVSQTIKTGPKFGTYVRAWTDSITCKTKVQDKHPPAPLASATWTPGDPATKQAVIYLWQIGDAVFVGGLPELSTSTTDYIKQHSPFPYTFVGGMFDGGDYNMADMWNYQNFTYSSRDSTYMPGSAEAWAAQASHDLSQMWP